MPQLPLPSMMFAMPSQWCASCCLYLHHCKGAPACMQLLAEGEIWPGVQTAEFAARRKRLADALPPGGIAVIPAASRTFMTGAIPYAYRQASHARCCLCMSLCHHHPCDHVSCTGSQRGCEDCILCSATSKSTLDLGPSCGCSMNPSLRCRTQTFCT